MNDFLKYCIELHDSLHKIFRQDYGVRSLESILDIVKVMDFALQNGKVSNSQTVSLLASKCDF